MPHSVTAALARRALSTGDERTHAREYAVERCLAEHLGGRVEP